MLTLWRFYGQQDGIALGFDTAKLFEMTYDIRRSKAIDMIYLDRVHYGLEDSTLLARFSDAPEVVQMYANFLVAILNKNAEFDFPPDALTKFFILTCESKHPDYADEAEIWLVVAEATEGRENGRSRAPKPAPERVVIKYLDALTTVMGDVPLVVEIF